MSIEEDIAFLGRVPVFAQLGFAALQIVAIGSEAKRLDEGDVLFKSGEAADGAFVVQSGSLTLTRPGPDGSDETMVVGPGVLVGELALLTEATRPVTATAAEPTTVLRVSRSLFRKVLEGFPDAARAMQTRFAERIGRATDEITSMRHRIDRVGSKR